MSSLELQPWLDASTSVLFTIISDFRGNLGLGLGVRTGLNYIFRQECCSRINKICWSKNMSYFAKSRWHPSEGLLKKKTM